MAVISMQVSFLFAFVCFSSGTATNFKEVCVESGSKVYVCRGYEENAKLMGSISAVRMEFQRRFSLLNMAAVKGLQSVILPSCDLMDNILNIDSAVSIYDQTGKCVQDTVSTLASTTKFISSAKEEKETDGSTSTVTVKLLTTEFKLTSSDQTLVIDPIMTAFGIFGILVLLVVLAFFVYKKCCRRTMRTTDSENLERRAGQDLELTTPKYAETVMQAATSTLPSSSNPSIMTSCSEENLYDLFKFKDAMKKNM